MPGLDPGIHAFLSICQDVDGRTCPAKTMRKGCCPAPILQYLSYLFTLRLSRRSDPLPPAARSTSPLQEEVGSVPRCAVTSSVSFVSLGCAAFLVGCAPSPCKGEGRGGGQNLQSDRCSWTPFEVRRHASRGFSARVQSSHRLVMPGLDPGIHAFLSICQDVDGRTSPAMTMRKGCCPALKGAPKMP
jgi:hypothetical protein